MSHVVALIGRPFSRHSSMNTLLSVARRAAPRHTTECSSTEGMGAVEGATAGRDPDAGVDVSRSPAARSQSYGPDPRRVLQLVLATLWLVDGLLQFQPFMFSRAFGTQMLAGTAQGNPRDIAHSITWADLVIGHHSVLADGLFALVQVLIGFGIAWRKTVRPALAASIAWSCGVWWFGEGLGGLFSGTANPVTGAPGAVLLYALLAVVLWPVDRPGTTPRFVAARAVGEGVARALWVALWGLLCCVAVLGANRSPQGLNQMVRQMASGQPSWLAGVDHHVAHLLAQRGLGVSVALAAMLGIVAVGVVLPTRTCRITTTLAVALSLGIWVLGENFGGLFTGSGTDPNSGPLLVLIAAAYWPYRTRSISDTARRVDAMAA